ncbi:MAG: 30S ribosome-binding factor RbfA [Clostridia bacterium]|nr:30S ribosome-binding factor RbfA [Clostridia bacterium]MBR3685312.1 30S ribosome-binding factor RbfA [Clostridia bacterium]
MNIDRVNSEIMKELMGLIRNELKDPRVRDCQMLSIMRVETTGDLKYAKVFVSVMDGNAQEVVKGLNASAGFLRNALFNRLKIRAVPTLIFVLDDSIDYGFKIEKILKEIKTSSDKE